MPRTDWKKRKSQRRIKPVVDHLEGRALLSATALSHSAAVAQVAAPKVMGPVAKVEVTQSKIEAPYRADLLPAVDTTLHTNLFLAGLTSPKTDTANPIAGLYTPSQLETAYGLNPLGAANEGQGQTIGIVDVFNDPNIISDTNKFSAEYGLPQFNATGGPTLVDYSDTALGTVSNSSTNSNSGNDTSSESSLDVEMAHAMAPMANIIFVAVPAGSTEAAEFVNLLKGAQYAATQGASVVSVSYGDTEANIDKPANGGNSNTVATDDSTYLATGVLSTIAVSFSAGDSGQPGGFPADSPNVIAVGGTTLHLASSKGKYFFETAWGGISGAGAGGGGISTVFSTPTYQSANGVNYGDRSIPDVSLVADPYTAVSVYDSWDKQDWTGYGGTSVASPLFAGILAIAQEDSVAAGNGILTTAQIHNAIYSAYNSSSYSTYFNDVALGSNDDVGGLAGYSATTGYDLATGLGSPIASTLVPYLASL
jgi:subtilase family serine protease